MPVLYIKDISWVERARKRTWISHWYLFNRL